MAHILAWTLKCATKEGEEEYGKVLNDYSKKILFYLLFGKAYKDKMNMYSVKDVKVWREWQKLDIRAEVYLVDNNQKDTKIALFVELKLHTHTSERQLEGYKKASADYGYANKGFEERFVLLGVWDDAVSKVDAGYCQNQGFAFLTFENILNDVFTEGGDTFVSSGNVIFDEFWTGYWG